MMISENLPGRLSTSGKLPSFDYFFWPILEFMKEEGEEVTRLQAIDAVCKNFYQASASKTYTEHEKEELSYRVGRAFDLLAVAEIVEERLGNLFALSNGGLTITFEEASNLHRHVRNLDNYFHDNGEAVDHAVESKEQIAKDTVRFLKGEPLNELQLKEKLVKDFIERNGIGRNMKVVNGYLKQADYVKSVLKAEEIVAETEDGTFVLREPADEAEHIIEEHYHNEGLGSISRGFQTLIRRVRARAKARYGKALMKQLAYDMTAIFSIIGLTWLFARESRKNGQQ